MKSLVQNEDCSIQPNALVHLSRTLQRNCDYDNCHINETISGQSSSILPHNSTNDQLKTEYLNECTSAIASPDTFCMYQLSEHLSLPSDQSESQLTINNKSESLSTHHDPLLLSSSNQTEVLSSEWVNQYVIGDNDTEQSLMNTSSNKSSQQLKSLPLPSTSSLSSNKMINRQLVNNNTKYGVVQSSEMLSSDYLATIDQQFNGATNDIQDEPIDLAKDLLNYMESEWDNLEGDQTPSSMTKTLGLEGENEYKMIENNPYLNEINQFESGSESYENGDLLNAILHLESVIHENPSNSQAWYMLGLCQAENERDLQAIAAFKKSIQIDPKNAEAILALSVSYANESMPNESLRLLDEWLSVHPIYGSDNADRISISNTKSYSLDENHFIKVEERFMKAVQKQSESVDVQLQNALSILYNLNENYQRAIDSLNIALSIEPDNARLWNRLGATLANAGKPTQAIFAYKRALSIYPGCVRTRFNIAVSCMLLDSYHDAISHLISALELQQSNELKQQHLTDNNANDDLLSLTLSSSSMWTLLHQAIIRSMTESSLNQSSSSDLLTAVRARDLITLKRLLHQIQ